MKTILTIDCDFFMQPCIQLYNDLITEKVNRDILWERIFKDLDCERFMSHNEENLQFMLKCIEGLECPIYIGLDHHSILRAMQNMHRNDPTFTGPFDIINIDHHHDICYTTTQLDQLFRMNYVTCGDWVGFIKMHNLLGTYYWVANPNSRPYDPNFKIFSSLENIKFVLLPKENFECNPKNVDMCYISSSLEFIPPTQLGVYFRFLRKIISLYKEKIIWYGQSYDNVTTMELIQEGINKLPEMSMATESI